MHYHNILISLFEPMAAIRRDGDEATTDGITETSPAAQSIVADSKHCLETLVRLYYSHHGFDSSHTLMVQFLSVLGFSSVAGLARRDASPDGRRATLSTAILCAMGLRAQGHSFYLAEVVASMMRDSLGPADGALLRDHTPPADDDGRKALVALHIHSEWPINITGLADAEEHRIDYLIGAYGNLVVDESSPDGSPSPSRASGIE